MRSPSALLRSYLQSYPLSDRATIVYDGQSGLWCSLLTGLALPLVGVVGRKLGMGASQIALLMSFQFIGLLANVWLGHLARAENLVAFMFWPYLLGRGSLLAIAFVASPGAFMAVMALYYLATNISGPAYTKLMRSNYSDKHRGRAMGHIRIMMQVVAALCAAAAGAVLQLWPEGFRLLFPLSAVAGIMSSLLFLRVRPRRRALEAEKGAPQRGFGASLAEACADRRFMIFLAITFVAGMPDKIMIPLEPIRLVDELGSGYGAAGLVLGTVPLVGAVVGYFICSSAAGKADPFILLVATMLLFSTRFLCFSLASTPAHLVPGVFLSGIANAGWDLLPFFAVLLLADESRVGFYMGLSNTLVGLRGLMGPAIGSWLYEGRGMRISDVYLLAFWIEIAGAVLLFVFWLVERRYRNFRRVGA